MPSEVVSVCPCRGVPLIAGSVVFVGAAIAAVTVVVWFEVAAVEPALFVAVTTTRRVDATSAARAV